MDDILDMTKAARSRKVAFLDRVTPVDELAEEEEDELMLGEFSRGRGARGRGRGRGRGRVGGRGGRSAASAAGPMKRPRGGLSPVIDVTDEPSAEADVHGRRGARDGRRDARGGGEAGRTSPWAADAAAVTPPVELDPEVHRALVLINQCESFFESKKRMQEEEEEEDRRAEQAAEQRMTHSLQRRLSSALTEPSQSEDGAPATDATQAMAPGAGHEATSGDQEIKITLRLARRRRGGDTEGGEFEVTVRMDDRVERLALAAASRMGAHVSRVQLHGVDGELSHSSSIEDAGLEEEDCVDVTML